jgi:mRNA interferase HigB
MRVIAYGKLRDYGVRYPEAKPSLKRWHKLVRGGRWTSTSDVLALFGNAKVVTADRMRFEIHGGNHRLIAAFDFQRLTLYIKFLGTHAEYDRVDARTVSQF